MFGFSKAEKEFNRQFKEEEQAEQMIYKNIVNEIVTASCNYNEFNSYIIGIEFYYSEWVLENNIKDYQKMKASKYQQIRQAEVTADLVVQKLKDENLVIKVQNKRKTK